MKAGADRRGRQDNDLRGRSTSKRSTRRTLSAAILAVLALVATTAVSAEASTGGASSAGPGGAAASGQNIAFTPMRTAGATWYGPGLYGRHTACGQVLRPDTLGVANRNLPCGTTVKFLYQGHSLVTQVIDRGPYTRGNSWDLTNGARLALGFNGAGQVHYAVALNYARH
ncbi:MAG: septal ring lytic transglycosylase RlpA family protein [Solirubrobacterales bacterium]